MTRSLDLQQLLESVAGMDRATALEQLERCAAGPLAAPEVAVNLAYALQQRGNLELAGSLGEQLVKAHPDFAPGWARLGQIELDLGHLDRALKWSEKATVTSEECSFSRVCLGIVLRALGRVTAATQQFATALNQVPDNPVAWSHYGLCLSDQFQHEMALSALQTAIDLDPDSALHWSNRLMSAQYDPGLTSETMLSDARRFASHLNESALPMNPRKAKKIHLAYLSPDLYNHPVGRLLLPVLRAHDQQRFELTILADGTRTDPLTKQISASANRFVSTHELDDSALATLLREIQVDVVVDLAGHTANNRLPAFARRLAPVQVAWLGYVGTTGLTNMDAVVLGEAHCTAATQHFFVEPIRTVPGTHFVYQPPEYLPEIEPVPAGHIRFASFNNTAKLNTEVMACWCEILKQLPDATLLLKWRTLTDPLFAQHVRARFANLGLAPERLLLQPHSDHVVMLAGYNEVDIALDPFPFSGGATTFEALSMGVPVVTLAWQRPCSRQGAAVLRQIDLEDLVASSARQYGQLAVKLANDAERRNRLRHQLRPKIFNHCNGHAEVVAAGLESIYTELLAAAD